MKRIVVSGAVLALAVAGLAPAQAAPSDGFKVTGGGQTFPFDAAVEGPGDTIGFNAQQTAPQGDDGAPARGQVQYVDREAGKQVANIHGSVTCLRVEGNRAVIGGQITRGGESDFFQLDVLDSGRESRGTDMVVFTEADDAPSCDEVRNFDEDPVLARGNVTIHQPQR